MLVVDVDLDAVEDSPDSAAGTAPPVPSSTAARAAAALSALLLLAELAVVAEIITDGGVSRLLAPPLKRLQARVTAAVRLEREWRAGAPFVVWEAVEALEGAP